MTKKTCIKINALIKFPVQCPYYFCALQNIKGIFYNNDNNAHMYTNLVKH